MELAEAGAIVFGGASGLGEATARRLVEAGAGVVIADVNAERGAGVANEIGARFEAVDVTESEAIGRALKAAAQPPRGLRISVCCAGIGPPARIVGRHGPAPLELYERVIGVNLLGTINVLRLAAAAMASNEPEADGERGVCVNTASIAAYEGQIGQTPYSASKGGIVGLTLPAARDLARFGVRVMTIAPGLFDTPLLAGLPDPAREALAASIPFPRKLGAPAEFAALVAHIVENPMLNGEVIRLDGGLRMAPQ